MAKKVFSVCLDDLDGSNGASTVRLSFLGADYEIDLTEDNYEGLAAKLAPYLDVARRVGGRLVRPRFAEAGEEVREEVALSALARTPSSANGVIYPVVESGNADQNRAIRSWARRQGYRVGDKGRIAQEIREAFKDAGNPVG